MSISCLLYNYIRYYQTSAVVRHICDKIRHSLNVLEILWFTSKHSPILQLRCYMENSFTSSWILSWSNTREDDCRTVLRID